MMRERRAGFKFRRVSVTIEKPGGSATQPFNVEGNMKILFTAIASLALCACASSPTSQRLVETGEACAAKGKFIKVANWENTQNFYFWDSYKQPDVEVSCR